MTMSTYEFCAFTEEDMRAAGARSGEYLSRGETFTVPGVASATLSVTDNDSRLSGDGVRSCYSCHVCEKGLTDGRATALGAFDKPLTRSATLVHPVPTAKASMMRALVGNRNSPASSSEVFCTALVP